MSQHQFPNIAQVPNLSHFSVWRKANAEYLAGRKPEPAIGYTGFNWGILVIAFGGLVALGGAVVGLGVIELEGNLFLRIFLVGLMIMALGVFFAVKIRTATQLAKGGTTYLMAEVYDKTRFGKKVVFKFRYVSPEGSAKEGQQTTAVASFQNRNIQVGDRLLVLYKNDTTYQLV